MDWGHLWKHVVAHGSVLVRSCQMERIVVREVQPDMIDVPSLLIDQS